jgi:hypothetical protein
MHSVADPAVCRRRPTSMAAIISLSCSFIIRLQVIVAGLSAAVPTVTVVVVLLLLLLLTTTIIVSRSR